MSKKDLAGDDDVQRLLKMAQAIQNQKKQSASARASVEQSEEDLGQFDLPDLEAFCEEPKEDSALSWQRTQRQEAQARRTAKRTALFWIGGILALMALACLLHIRYGPAFEPQLMRILRPGLQNQDASDPGAPAAPIDRSKIQGAATPMAATAPEEPPDTLYLAKDWDDAQSKVEFALVPLPAEYTLQKIELLKEDGRISPQYATLSYADPQGRTVVFQQRLANAKNAYSFSGVQGQTETLRIGNQSLMGGPTTLGYGLDWRRGKAFYSLSGQDGYRKEELVDLFKRLP